MARGAKYTVYNELRIYSNAAQARSYGTNHASTVYPNTGSDSGSYKDVSSVEGKGNAYVDTSWGLNSSEKPAFPVWWVPYWGGSGYLIGWTNDDKNYGVSKPTLNKSSMNAGETVTISTNRLNSAHLHTVRWRYGSGSWTTIGTAKGVGDSVSWTPSLSDIGSKIPNNVSGSFEISVITYNGTITVGEEVVKITISMPSNIVPSIPTHTITEATSGLAAKFGSYIQGKSKLKVVSSSSGAYGSTIKSYSTKISGVTYSGATITSNTINSGGTISVVTTVTDSRGRTSVKTTTVGFLAYTAPKITSFSANRALSNGTLSDSGTFARVAMNFTITSLSSKNDRSWKVEYRRSGGSWSTLSSGAVYSYNSSLTSASAILNTEYGYELRLTITDYFGSATANYSVSTAFELMDLHHSGTGLAIGKVAEKANTLQVGLDTEILGIFTAATQTPNGATEIPAGANLNNYQDPGFYYQNMNADATSESNYPVNLAGTLVVTKDAGVTQMYYVYNGSGLWYRAFYNGTWYAWREVYHTGNASFASSSHSHSGADITSGTVPLARLGITRSNATNGYININGTYIQWGRVAHTSGARYKDVTFPIAFPGYCRSIVASYHATSGGVPTGSDSVGTGVTSFDVTKTGARFALRAIVSDGPPNNLLGNIYYVAIGY